MRPDGEASVTRWRTGSLGCHVLVAFLVLTSQRTTVADVFNQHVSDAQFMTRSGSPYHIRELIVIERTGTLTIESGVVLNFHPGAGILVRGALIAKGNADARIVMDAMDRAAPRRSPDVRLVDGPSPLSGRLQVRHLGEWHSVCTNSRNWTVTDYETTCRQMGFTGGRYVQWMDRVNSSWSRPLLYENPRCFPGSASLLDCDWGSRRVGAGVCDYHPDLGMECSGYYSQQSGLIGTRWRGVRFENARHKKELTQGNTLYVKVSESFLHYVDILNAGVERDGRVVSALETHGVAPQMEKLRITGSAFNGLNATEPGSPVVLRGATLTGNAGYGAYVNTSTGSVLLDACTVSDNGHEGVKYAFHDRIPDQAGDAVVGTHDLCTSASTMNPVYPLPIFAESLRESTINARCEKRFTTSYGQVLTLHFVHLMAAEALATGDDAAEIVVHDGPDSRSPLIARFAIRNETRPQSVTTTRNAIWMLYTSRASSRNVLHMELTSGLSKSYDLNVTNSIVSNNGARGVLVENVRSLVHVQGTTVRENHMAGVQVADGAGDVNVTSSYVAHNFGDGVNMTYSGGRVNISYSTIESNRGHGVVAWFNETSLKLAISPEMIVAYNTFATNQWSSVVVGNFCTPGAVNVSGNVFNHSNWNALEILSCWKPAAPVRHITVGHNQFLHNSRLGVVLSPAVSMNALIEHNLFRYHKLGCLLVRNPDALELEALTSSVTVINNRFEFNAGWFVANLGLSQYAGDAQTMLFTRNWVKRNTIRQPFASAGLHPRSRVAAVIVVGSSNVNITRNMIDNPDSNYEIGSHLEDQQIEISVVKNWLGARNERDFYYRLFDRKDRYNLARIAYKPFLLHDTNFDTDSVSNMQDFVPSFVTGGSREIGGEVTGQEELVDPGIYHVTRDIVIHPTGRLTVAFGVTLRFEHSLGMMVGGELVAEGSSSSPDGVITFSLMDRILRENVTHDAAVRLVGGATSEEGRLQVRIGDRWGTVCNEGWTIQSAAVACHQMGLVLNPRDWFIEPSHMQSPMGTEDAVLMSHVDCTEWDTDVRSCFHRATTNQTENYCGHDMDVGLRCHDVSWAGIRFGMTAKKSILRSAIVERAGLFDYATHSFQPALRIDFHHHVLDRLRLVNNDHDGLGLMYSDMYYPERIPSLKNSVISANRGHGLSMRSLGIRLADCSVEDNAESGIHYNPMITRQELREMVGWLAILKPDKFINVPDTTGTVDLEPDNPRYLRTARIKDRPTESTLVVQTDQRNVIGMQVINPIQNSSTETVLLLDYGELSNEVWNVRVNLTSFPTVSSTYKLTIKYSSGADAKGGMLILLTAYRRTDLQVQRSRLLTGPIPMLSVSSSNIRRNGKGLSVIHYNLFLSPDGNRHYLRKANETIQLIGCEISQSREEAILIHTPYRDAGRHPLAEIKYMINFTTITDNQRAIVQSSRDIRDSNNLFHWILQNDTIRNNRGGGFDVRLPYVWQYNENYTHTVYVDKCVWTANRHFGLVIGGHFARVNVTDSLFEDNDAHPGLVSLRGMEKELFVLRNVIHRNTGNYMMEFDIDSQSEILGEVSAYFSRNVVRDNGHATRSMLTNPHLTASYAIAMKGVQKVNITDNLLGPNTGMDYELLAGIRTAKLDNFVNVVRNYWGTADLERIRERIFDFDDWNSYAIARFRPYYLEPTWDGGQSLIGDVVVPPMDVEKLGGRLYHDLVLHQRDKPYTVYTDLTVMPGVILTILPGVELEFYPSVGILVLGILRAEGHWQLPIRMRPVTQMANFRIARQLNRGAYHGQADDSRVRLCLEGECRPNARQGYLELFNGTTQQWVPICDRRFGEQNARVVCRQLGMETFHEFKSFGRRWEFQYSSLSRIRYWPEPIQCIGTEGRLDECDMRANGQVYDHVYSCPWDSEDFVFIDCGTAAPSATSKSQHWGGIRFSVASFEENVHEYRTGLPTHMDPNQEGQSRLYYVHITGAGILHGEKSPAVMSVLHAPFVQQVNITHCASDGVSLVSPSKNLPLLDNRIEYNGGVGISVLMLNGETRDADLSAFSPLRYARGLAYNTFGILDACDPGKQVLVEERVLIYYKYDNRPADCVKIFTSRYGVKTFGFRLLQLNLVNSTSQPWEPDSLTLYDGDIYNITSTLIAQITSETTGPAKENRLYRSKKPSLSLKLHSSGADSTYGFVAEIITLPVATIGFGRDIRHNISYSGLHHNRMGAVYYSSAGEINPLLTMEWNQIVDNGAQLYGNFTTCDAAVELDVQNMDSLFFRNNLIRRNQGGLKIQSDSNGVPTSLKAVIHNNVFADNNVTETVYLEGRRSSPYQEVTLYHNYVTRSHVPYKDVILLNQVVANLTENHVFNNLGYHIMDVYGFGRVRAPIFQTFYHNSFHKNYATDRDNRGTVIAGSSGQRYIDNIFVNPDNDYEMIALNWTGNATWETSVEMQRTAIQASNNWWGYNETTAVVGRIRDFRDVPELLQVRYEPYYFDNRTVLSGKCDPGWSLVGDTCLMYIGVPMNFSDAKEFCKKDNASLPYLMSNYYGVMEFLMSQQIGFDYFARAWVQHLDMIGQCVVFVNRRVERSPCDLLLPFMCEADPHVVLDPLGWTDDALTVALLGASAAALLLIVLCVAFWASKSRHRAEQRFERRNSIRASIRSSRSFNSLASSSGFLDANGTRRKPLVPHSARSGTNGSVDSIAKSQFESSVDDNRSFDIYEAEDHPANRVGLPLAPQQQGFAYAQLDNRVAQRPLPQVTAVSHHPAGQLTFENQGFRDTSTYASQPTSRAPSEYWADSSSIDGQSTHTASVSVHHNGAVAYRQPNNHHQYSNQGYNRENEYSRPRAQSEAGGLDNFSTVSLTTNSTMGMKREMDDSDAGSAVTLPQPSHARKQEEASVHKKQQPLVNRPPSTTRSQQLLETNFDNALMEPPPPRHAATTGYLAASNENFFSGNRSKSTPLETDM